MTDTTPVTMTIKRLITAGTPARELLKAVTVRFPDLTSAELSVALQEATAAAEKRAAQRRAS